MNYGSFEKIFLWLTVFRQEVDLFEQWMTLTGIVIDDDSIHSIAIFMEM